MGRPRNGDRYKITNTTNLKSLFIRLTFMAVNIFLYYQSQRVVSEYYREHNKGENTIFYQLRFLTNWGCQLTIQYFALTSYLTIFLMTKPESNFPTIFGRKLRRWMDYLSDFHFIVMSTQFIINAGYWGQVRTDAFKYDFAGCTTELKMWVDSIHGPQYLFLLLDCLLIRGNIQYNIKFQLKPIAFSLIYVAWNLFLYLALGITVYPVMDWVSVGCYKFIGTILVSNFVGGILTIFFRKTASNFLDPAIENKKAK